MKKTFGREQTTEQYHEPVQEQEQEEKPTFSFNKNRSIWD